MTGNWIPALAPLDWLHCRAHLSLPLRQFLKLCLNYHTPMTQRNLRSRDAVTQGQSNDGPREQPPTAVISQHSPPQEASHRHCSALRHRKGSSASKISCNTAVPITIELFQGFKSAQVLLHAPGKARLNSPVSLVSTEASSPHLRKYQVSSCCF